MSVILIQEKGRKRLFLNLQDLFSFSIYKVHTKGMCMGSPDMFPFSSVLFRIDDFFIFYFSTGEGIAAFCSSHSKS